MKMIQLSLCALFFLMAGCKESADSAANKILYPFAYADFKRDVPDYPPPGLRQVYLEAVDSNNDPMRIHSWYHKNLKATHSIVFFHGNNENLEMVKDRGIYHQFIKMNVNFIVIDYPGLGRSNSFPNQYNMTQAGLAAFEFALNEFPGTEFILWGRSLGAGLAAQVAPLVQEHLSAFILTSPWATIKKLADSKSKLSNQLSEEWLRSNTYDSVAAARQIHVPTLVIHGKKDLIIPYRFGKKVFEAFPPDVAVFHSYPKIGHRKMLRTKEVWDNAIGFLKSL